MSIRTIKTQIGPLRVKWPEGIQDEKKQDLMGVFNCYRYEVAVRRDLPQGIKRQTLLHELIHMLQYNAGLKFNEQVADSLSSGLIHLLDNNPKLAEFLLKK